MAGRRSASDKVRVVIDRSSAMPLHVQLKQSMQDQIAHGRWRPGDLLPAEPELCRLFAVSRTTVRQAMTELAYDGMIVRERGRGTFVAPPKLTESAVQRLSGFYEDMLTLGHPPVSQILRQESVRASKHIAALLKVPVGGRVVEIERLRFVHDDPVVLTTTYLPEVLCPGLRDADLSRRSLYEYLESECGLTLARGRRTIEAVAADARQAKLLRTETRAPLILIHSLSYLADGRPIEYYHALHRGDRSRFEVELVRGPGRGRSAKASVKRQAGLPPGGGTLVGRGRKRTIGGLDN